MKVEEIVLQSQKIPEFGELDATWVPMGSAVWYDLALPVPPSSIVDVLIVNYDEKPCNVSMRQMGSGRDSIVTLNKEEAVTFKTESDKSSKVEVYCDKPGPLFYLLGYWR